MTDRREIMYPAYVRGRIDWKHLRRFIYSIRSRRAHLAKVRAVIEFVSKLTNASAEEVANCLLAFYDNSEFFRALERQYQTVWPKWRLFPYHFETFAPASGGSELFTMNVMYLIARLTRPDIIVETGGAFGKSTVYFLQALEENGKGVLYTLDLHPDQVGKYTWWPAGKPSCFLVPPHLQSRHRLILGDAKETLPPLLQSLGKIDIFQHDSDHSYEHMLFEYRTAWLYLEPEGILLSDDIRNNPAFVEFSQEVNGAPVRLLQVFGGLRK